MPYLATFGPCVRCGQVFSFNADAVPSIVIDDVAHPICEPCVVANNRVRAELGEPPIVPLPDAYRPQELV